MDEEALARAFAAREAWAYEAAYRLHGALLCTATEHVLRDRQDAQDCVHDTLLRLWRRRDAFVVQRGTLRAFLAVCVRNEALSRARKGRNRDRIASAVTAPQTEADFSQDVAESQAIAGALRALNDKQRESIVLAYYRGLTLAEIAQQCGEPLGTVKSRLSAALRRLRELFSEGESAHAST